MCTTRARTLVSQIPLRSIQTREAELTRQKENYRKKSNILLIVKPKNEHKITFKNYNDIDCYVTISSC